MDLVVLMKGRLERTFTPTYLDIIDESFKHIGHTGARKGGGHFNVTIVSPEFREQTLIQRHRMVYTAMGELMHTAIHALSIQAYTPDEFSS